jgi:hypothetical protein
MCTTDHCNDLDYDIHSKRSRRVLNLPQISSSGKITPSSSFFSSEQNEADEADEADDDDDAITSSSISVAIARRQQQRENGSYYNDEEDLYEEEGGREEGEEDEGEGEVLGDDEAGTTGLSRIPRQAGQGKNMTDGQK